LQKNKKNLNLTDQNEILNGLEEHYEPIRIGPDRNQFISQDRLLSKWACIMQTSPNGIVWYDCKLVKYCENCGDKTLICPHKLSLNECIIKIPPLTNYLKFFRPKLKYNEFTVKRALDIFKMNQLKMNEADLQYTENTAVMTNYISEYTNKANKDLDALKTLDEGNPKIGMVFFLRTTLDFN
jgi:hypothetical protein